MIKGFKEFVSDTLDQGLKEQYPAISKCDLKLFRGDVAFVVPTTCQSISGYIVVVQDHHGRARFAIEIGWSTKGQFPTLIGRPSFSPFMPTVERIEFQKDEYFCRLSNIWSKKDYWWGKDDPGGSGNPLLSYEDEVKFRQADGLNWQRPVVNHVADVVDKIQKYGIPYLDEFFASKQVSRI